MAVPCGDLGPVVISEAARSRIAATLGREGSLSGNVEGLDGVRLQALRGLGQSVREPERRGVEDDGPVAVVEPVLELHGETHVDRRRVGKDRTRAGHVDEPVPCPRRSPLRSDDLLPVQVGLEVLIVAGYEADACEPVRPSFADGRYRPADLARVDRALAADLHARLYDVVVADDARALSRLGYVEACALDVRLLHDRREQRVAVECQNAAVQRSRRAEPDVFNLEGAQLKRHGRPPWPPPPTE